MVRAFMPQNFPRLLVTNTNFPPQGQDLERFIDAMLYENFVRMEYEDLIEMDYEG